MPEIVIPAASYFGKCKLKPHTLLVFVNMGFVQANMQYMSSFLESQACND